MKQFDQSLLRRCYLHDGLSASKIAQKFSCSQHRVNYWLAKYHIQKRSISEALYQSHNPNGDPFKIKKISSRADARLLGLGVGLYWGEGNKKNKGSIRLGNTDASLIRTFIDFLIDILGIQKQKLRFGLQIFTDISERGSLRFWLRELKKFDIKRTQFFKVTVTQSRSIGNYKEKSRYGVLTVHFSNTKLKKILDAMLPT